MAIFEYIEYIDTLYLYGSVDFNQYGDDILDAVGREAQNFLGVSQNRVFYEFEDGLRVGYLTKDSVLRYNSYTYLFQIPNVFLKTLDLSNLEEMLKKYLYSKEFLKGIELDILIQRLDYTYTFKSDDKFKICSGVISRFRQTSIIKKNGIIETLYIGNRRNGAVIRLYNKSLELLTNLDPKKVDFFKSVFDTLDNLYTYEFELQRKYLTKYKQFKKLSLSDIDLVIKFAKTKMSDVKIYEENEKNISLIKRNLRSKINPIFCLSMLVDEIDITNLDLIDYTSSPSFDLLIDAISKKIYNYNKKSFQDLTFDELIDKINEKIEYLSEQKIRENENKKKELL